MERHVKKRRSRQAGKHDPSIGLVIAADTAIFATCIAYLATSQLWALLAWEAVAILYLVGGLAVVWRGVPHIIENTSEVRAIARWLWLPPLLSGAVGANAAIVALVARSSGAQDIDSAVLVVAACIGIVLSWALVQVGFAQMYQVIDATGASKGIRFPDDAPPSTLNYLYFAFAVGTSFTSSDAAVIDIRIRRIVLLHGIVSFFYNALVVAVAFQVLQWVIAR